MEIPIKNQRMELFLLSGMPNLPSEFQENWNDGTLSGIAIAMKCFSGIIPAPLFKLVVVLGLTAWDYK